MHRFNVLCIGLILATSGLEALAESSAEKGQRIFAEYDRSRLGFGAYSVDQKLTTTYRDKLSVKLFRLYGFEKKEGNKSLIIFDKPKDNKGTALLNWHHDLSDDEQWLYLPNFKRIKKISSSAKRTPFVASAFSYEDVAILSRQSSAGFTYHYLRDELLDDTATYVVEGTPTDKKTAYLRAIFWLDTNNYRILKIVFYDKKDRLAKTLVASDFALYLEQYWQAKNLHIVDHLKNKVSELQGDEYIFRAGIKENTFSKTGLLRIK